MLRRPRSRLPLPEPGTVVSFPVRCLLPFCCSAAHCALPPAHRPVLLFKQASSTNKFDFRLKGTPPMKRTEIALPELGLIAATRGLLGAGVGLLLADRISEKPRKAVGWTLLLIAR